MQALHATYCRRFSKGRQLSRQSKFSERRLCRGTLGARQFRNGIDVKRLPGSLNTGFRFHVHSLSASSRRLLLLLWTLGVGPLAPHN
jgi:hypothetical protein